MMSRGPSFRLLGAACVVLAATFAALAPGAVSGATTPTGPATATFGPKASFAPATAAVHGSTDVYHCFLLDPHLTSDRELVSSEFLPGARKEVHHAIYFLIPPNLAHEARSLNATSHDKGWSCFGAPLNPNGTFDNTTWLGGWAPGPVIAHPTPKGTAIAMPAGSLVVMQIHYNLLAGTSPDRSRVRITTVPAAHSHLQQLQSTKYVAPPDLPCPTGVTGPCVTARPPSPTSCRAPASRRPCCSAPSSRPVRRTTTRTIPRPTATSSPPRATGRSTSRCTSSARRPTCTCSASPSRSPCSTARRRPCSPRSPTTTSTVSGSYASPKGTWAEPGDKVRVTCTYDPRLRQELPSLRKLPARFVTWGDGSSDEMCLGTVGWVAH